MDQTPVFSKTKLALWHTRNFKPIVSHRQLEDIMTNLGFIGLPPSVPMFGNGLPWKEYVYKAGTSRQCPRLRLPHPQIDGLHIKTYKAFLDAANFYLKMDDISLLFHVRGMPIRQVDMDANWWHMDGDESFYLYREGTADQVLKTINSDKGDSEKDEDDDHDGWIIGSKSRRSQTFQMVSYSEIIVQKEVMRLDDE